MLQHLSAFTNWLYPRICVCCGFNSYNQDIDLCEYCKANLPWLHNRCYQCGAHLQKLTEAINCEKCQLSPPSYDRVCALFAYKPPLPKLINTLKFGRQLYPGALFAQLLLEAITQRWYSDKALPAIIVPVPLHNARLRQRGYNQAVEIGIPIAKALNIPLGLNICQRIRHTTAQARLKRNQRLRNLSGAFRLIEYTLPEHIALLDDVVTTGSTIRAVSKVLRVAGVQQIDVWCVCRG